MDGLQETALVGTDKKPLDVLALPDAVKQALTTENLPDPEWQFLEANSLLNFYQLAGTYPKQFKGAVEENIIEEDRAIASEELLQLYSKIEMVDHQLKDTVTRLWLNALIGHQSIVSPGILVNLLRDGRNLSGATKSKIVQVIGKKGRWILRNDQSLSYPVTEVRDAMWTEGTTQERKAIFTTLHTKDSEQAINLLKSTWDTEAIVSKRMFLELVKYTFVAADTPFIEGLYASEFKYSSKEKKTEKECRRLAVSMLLHEPETNLFKETARELQKYLAKTKKGIVGLVTGKDNFYFNLPDHDDEFWNAGLMEATYGFEVKNFDIAVFSTAQQFWLSYFLEFLPMSYWSQLLGVDDKRCVHYWLHDSAFQTKIRGDNVSIYETALIENAISHTDKTLALTLINTVQTRAVIPLLSIINPGDFESFISKNKYWDDIEYMMSCPFDEETSWSRNFSEKVIANAYELAIQSKAHAQIGKIIAQYAHPDSIDDLYKYNDKARDSASYNVWNTAIFQVAQAAMEIRNKINALKP